MCPALLCKAGRVCFFKAFLFRYGIFIPMETRRSFAFFILALIVLIFALNTVANTYAWYFTYIHFDKLMHFLGGVFIGSSALYLYFLSTYIVPRHTSFIAACFIATGTLALVGIFWEFFEYALYAGISKDTLTAQLYLKQGLPNTLSDLCFDLLGSIFATLLFYTLWNKNHSR
jgi:hypothetical protein